MNTRTLIYKIQKALKQKGIVYTLNTYQFYSEEQDRTITMYELKQEGKRKVISASQIYIVKYLVNQLNIVNGKEPKYTL